MDRVDRKKIEGLTVSEVFFEYKLSIKDGNEVRGKNKLITL